MIPNQPTVGNVKLDVAYWIEASRIAIDCQTRMETIGHRPRSFSARPSQNSTAAAQYRQAVIATPRATACCAPTDIAAAHSSANQPPIAAIAASGLTDPRVKILAATQVNAPH